MMTAREKNLALAVGLCAPLILGYFGWTWYSNAHTQRAAKLQTAKKQLDLLQAKQQYTKAVAATREEWKRDSLPDNTHSGMNQFQLWLGGIANKHQLASAGVIGSFIGETAGVGKKFKFTMDAQGSLEQLSKFLEEFARADRMQEIRVLTIEPDKSGKLKINLIAEAMAVAGNKNTTLPMETRPALASLDASKSLVSRNVFAEYIPPPPVRKYEPPPTPPAPPPPPAPYDLSQFTFVTAVIENNGEPEVWITHRPWGADATKKHLRAGDSFEFDAVRGKVVNIDIPSQTVDLEIGNRKARVANGNSLASGGSSKSSGGFANNSGEGNSGRSDGSSGRGEGNSGRGEGNSGRGFGDGNSMSRPSGSGFGSKGSGGFPSRDSSKGGSDSRRSFGRPGGN